MSGFHFRKYKKSFLLRKRKNFFNSRAWKLHFWNYNDFLGCGCEFFFFLGGGEGVGVRGVEGGLGWEECQVALKYTTGIQGIQAIFYREKKIEKSLLSKKNQKGDNFPSTVFESNEHGWSFPVFAGLSRLWHMKNKGVQQSNAWTRNSEAADGWKVTPNPPSRHVVVCADYPF